MENQLPRLGYRGRYPAQMMQYSIRTIFASAFLIATILVGFFILTPIWNRPHSSGDRLHYPFESQSQREEVEASLFRHILQDAEFEELARSLPEFEYEGVIYNDRPESIEIQFAIGRRDGSWIAPSESMVKRIGLSSVGPVRDGLGDATVHYVTNIRWTNRNTVTVDQGMYCGPLCGYGSDDVEYRYIDGCWQTENSGIDWVS